MTEEEKTARTMLKQVPWPEDVSWGIEVNSAIYYLVRILSSGAQADISRFEQVYRVPIYILWERVKKGDVDDLRGKWYAHNRQQGRRGDV